MAKRVCPWWVGYFLVSPLRRLRQNPATILQPWVTDGMTVLEPGPGMGFFTLELARLVGPRGRVVAVDVQKKMLDALKKRAARAGLGERVQLRQAQAETLGCQDLAGQVDFALAFALIHELPNVPGFFAEVRVALKPGARVLAAEPTHHVSEKEFAETLAVAEQVGFALESRPLISASLTAVLVRL